MTRLRAVGFDLDNTLYDQAQHMRSFFRVAAQHIAGCSRRPAAEIEAVFLEVLERRTSYYPRLFDEALETLAVQDNSVVQELISLYHRHRAELALFDGVRDMLHRLRSYFSLFLITDGNAQMQQGKLESLALDGTFDAVVLTGSHGKDWAKPSLRPYRHVLEQIGGAPAEYLYVGDNPMCDFHGARQLGMRTARVKVGPFAAHIAASPDHEADIPLQRTTDLERVLHDFEAVR